MTTPAIQRAFLPVLLIEDEPSIMALVSATLERNGYEVVCIEIRRRSLAPAGKRPIPRRRFRHAHARRRRRRPGPFLDFRQSSRSRSIKSSSSPATTPTKKPSPPCARSVRFIWKNLSACRISSRLSRKPWGKPGERASNKPPLSEGRPSRPSA